MKRVPSPHITPEMASNIKLMLKRGLYQHQIASVLGVNQGRISEVKTGKLHPKVQSAVQLPFDF